jgi:antitoxin ParD1/3/4
MNKNVSLTPELETLVNEKVKSGNCNSTAEFACEALRLLKELYDIKQIRRVELCREVMKGIDQIRSVQGIVYDSAEDGRKPTLMRIGITSRYTTRQPPSFSFLRTIKKLAGGRTILSSR